MNIIFDLDGTLSLDDHRRHFLLGETKDWDGYFSQCHLDKPNKPLIRIIKELSMPWNKIEIWSGRSKGPDNVWFDKTIEWFAIQGIGFVGERHPRILPIVSELKMRDYDDYRNDVVLKREWLREARAKGQEPDLVFEDRDRVVEMWREEGIPCLQAAPGDF